MRGGGGAEEKKPYDRSYGCSTRPSCVIYGPVYVWWVGGRHELLCPRIPTVYITPYTISPPNQTEDMCLPAQTPPSNSHTSHPCQKSKLMPTGTFREDGVPTCSLWSQIAHKSSRFFRSPPFPTTFGGKYWSKVPPGPLHLRVWATLRG